jgi:hypothetical protein
MDLDGGDLRRGLIKSQVSSVGNTKGVLHRDQIAVFWRGRQILAVMDELAGIKRNTSLKRLYTSTI